MKAAVFLVMGVMTLMGTARAEEMTISPDDPATTQASVEECQSENDCLPPGRIYRNVSCNQAKAILRGQGFGDVQRLDCTGKYYDFAAAMTGAVYKLRVRHSDGEVTVLERRELPAWDQ